MNSKQAEIDGKVMNILRNDADIFGENDNTVEELPRKIDNPFMRAAEAKPDDRYKSEEEEKVVSNEDVFAENESFFVDEIIDEV